MSAQYQLKAVRFAYADHPILAIDDQDLPQGKITALVGVNGSGKTTLLKILSFLMPPDSGEIRFSGQMVSGKAVATLKRRVGLVLQNPYLLKGKVVKNIEIGLKFRGVGPAERAIRVKKMLARRGMEKLAERSVKSLSGGEAQKTAIARTLVLDPAVILLDEPFTHLDRDFAEELEALIRNLRDEYDKTIIFTSHDQLQAQALSDHIYSLIDAGLVATPLSNLFHGRVAGAANQFDTGKIKIAIPPGHRDCTRLAIDPGQIVISKDPLDSSMRNSFIGEITAMATRNGRINLTVRGQECFQVYITPEALHGMHFKLHERVFISFKSSAVYLF